MPDKTKLQTDNNGFESASAIISRQGTSFIDVSATTITASKDWQGFCVRFKNAAGCTVTIPANLPSDISFGWSQETAGAITFVQGAGATIQSSGGLLKSAAQYAIGSVAGWGADGVVRLYGELTA